VPAAAADNRTMTHMPRFDVHRNSTATCDMPLGSR
jgi:hypothetical protein